MPTYLQYRTQECFFSVGNEISKQNNIDNHILKKNKQNNRKLFTLIIPREYPDNKLK